MPGKKPTKRASSERQRKFAGAELGRKRAGQSTETNMSEAQLRELARKPASRGGGGSRPKGKRGRASR